MTSKEIKKKNFFGVDEFVGSVIGFLDCEDAIMTQQIN